MASDDLTGVRSIAVLRALQLGDLLCTVPALRAIRSSFPKASVSLIGLPWARTFAERFSALIDEHIAMPGYPGLPEQPADIERAATFSVEMQRRHFDLVLQMQGDGSIVNPLAVLLGGRRTGGLYVPGNWCPDPDLFVPYPAEGHEIQRMLALPRHLGMSAEPHLEFPIRDDEAATGAALLESLGVARDFAVLHAGARDTRRRWPAIRFAAVGDDLASRGFDVVLTGTEDEREVTTSIARMMRAPAFNLAGRTPLGTLAALIRDARLLVSNDTGVSHLASALRTPSVVIFSASDPDRWAPLDRSLHRVVHGEQVDVARFAAASTASVVRQVTDLLRTAVPHAA